MNSLTYQQKILALRNIRTTANINTEVQINKVLKKAASDLTIILSSTKKDTFTYINYSARRDAINKVIQNMSRGIQFATQTSIQRTSDMLSDAYSDITSSFVKSHRYSFDMREAFSTVSTQAVENVISRVWPDKLNFSQRIWSINEYAKKSTTDIITSGIARGQSAIDMSKELTSFLTDPIITPATSWTTAIKPSISGKGTINYNALRLARTEINNTYRETLVLSNDANPITLGVHYNLSGSHKIADICNVWATIDKYGMGPGNYPAKNVPMDHPNGLCYYTEILRPASEWDNPKPTFKDQGLSKEGILATLGNDSDKDLAYKQYKSMDKLLKKVR